MYLNSAGAGRTGTYIAIDNLIKTLKTTKHIDAFNEVIKMRRNRKDMVRNVVSVKFVTCIVSSHGVPVHLLLVHSSGAQTTACGPYPAHEDFLSGPRSSFKKYMHSL